MTLLDQLSDEFNVKYNYVKSIVEDGKTTLWKKHNNDFFILSRSTKKNGYQLTCFVDNKPVSDRIRGSITHDDFINELVINDVDLMKVV